MGKIEEDFGGRKKKRKEIKGRKTNPGQTYSSTELIGTQLYQYPRVLKE